MKQFIHRVINLLVFPRSVSDEEQFYNQAIDLADLEWRMKLVQRGQAPFQKPYLDWPV